MNAQASPDLGDTDEFLHEIRFFPLQFGKLIDDDKQMGDRFLHIAAFVQLGVFVDIVDPRAVEHSLPPAVLTFDRHHGAPDLSTGEVGDGTQKVGESVKEVGHSAALVIDNKEADIIRAVFDRQRQQIGLQGLGLTGSCGACHQSVRSVVFLMHVHIHTGMAALDAHQSLYIFVDPVFAPQFLRVQIIETVYTVHFKEGHCIRDLAALVGLLDPHAGDRGSKTVESMCFHMVKFYLPVFLRYLLCFHDPAEGFVILQYIAALVGQMLDRVGQDHCRQPHFLRYFKNIVGDQLSPDQGGIRKEEDVMRHPVPVILVQVGDFILAIAED